MGRIALTKVYYNIDYLYGTEPRRFRDKESRLPLREVGEIPG